MANMIFTVNKTSTNSITLRFANYTGTISWTGAATGSQTFTNTTLQFILSGTPIGDYTVTVSGTASGLGLSDTQVGIPGLTGITQWGDLGLTYIRYLSSSGSSNFTIPNNIPSTVTDISWMFYFTGYFNRPLNGWDTSNITNMHGTFYGAVGFNQPLGLWDTSNVTDMTYMLNQTVSFNQNLSTWSVGHIPSQPTGFNTGANATWVADSSKQPRWGYTAYAPTDISLSNNQIQDSMMLSGTPIGVFTTTDANVGDTHTYSIVGGADGLSFYIINGELYSDLIPDYVTQRYYYINVRSTDQGGLFLEKAFTIEVIYGGDVAQLSLDSVSVITSSDVQENQSSGISFASVYAIDGDPYEPPGVIELTDTINYPDNSYFSVTPDLFRRILTNSVLNYEDRSSYTIKIKYDNSMFGGTYSNLESVFTINVLDSDDLATAISFHPENVETSVSINENELPSYLGTLYVHDEDISDLYNISIVTGSYPDDDKFSIVNNELFSLYTFDHEQSQSYTLLVRAINTITSDQIDRIITVNIIDVSENAAPSAISFHPTIVQLSAPIVENMPTGSLVGSLYVHDTDTLTSEYTFSLVAGDGDTDNNSFDVIGDQLVSLMSFNFESQQTYLIRVRATDGTNTIESQMTVSVTDIVEPDITIMLSNNILEESFSIGGVVGTLSTDDANPLNEYTFSLVSGTGSTHNSNFDIIDDQLITTVALNFDTLPVHQIRVQAIDSNLNIITRQFLIYVTQSVVVGRSNIAQILARYIIKAWENLTP